MVFRRPIIYTGIAITVMLYRTYLAYKEGKRAQYWAGLVSTGLLVLGIVINRYLFSSLAALVTGLISFGLLFSDSDTKKASTKKHSFSQNIFKLLGQSMIGIALLSFIGLNVTVMARFIIVTLLTNLIIAIINWIFSQRQMQKAPFFMFTVGVLLVMINLQEKITFSNLSKKATMLLALTML
ncbi:hypothetical protein [Streptococcus pluranimalium]|uniref:hypothetical protein n=1 Tax=Streptococcus pluranimalium TaxID=82348 RepID=UPI0040468C40